MINSKSLSACLLFATIVIKFLIFTPSFAFPQDVKSTIDSSYTLTEQNSGGEITESTEIKGKYTLEYDAFFGYFYDFSGKFNFEYSSTEKTDTPMKKSYAPSLDLKFRGGKEELSLSYKGSKDVTDATEDEEGTTVYANSYIVDLSLKPDRMPDTKFKWERKEDYEPGVSKSLGNKIDLTLKYELGDLGTNFKYSNSVNRDIFPEEGKTRDVSWELGMDYGVTISFVDLRLEYVIKESTSTVTGIDEAFVSKSKDYSQQAKVGLRSDFEILNRWETTVGYDFSYDQDFMEEQYKYKYEHKVALGVKRDLMRWAAFNLKYDFTNQKTVAVDTADAAGDDESIKHKLTGSIQWKPYSWLDGESKAERELSKEIQEGTDLTPGTEDKKEAWRYENSVQVTIGQKVKLSATQGYEESISQDLLEKTDTKYKLKGTYTPFTDLRIESSYDYSIAEDYETESGESTLAKTTKSSNLQIKLSFEKKLLDMVQFKVEKALDYKKKEDIDEVLGVTETTDFGDDSKVGLKFSEFIRGMSLDILFSQKISDNKEDEEPRKIDRSLNLKWNWDVMDFAFSSDYKFDEKGDAPDTLTWNTKVSWKRNMLEIGGEFQYSKTFALETDETKKYNLKFKLVF